jgi:hypothetical protein
VGSYEIGSAHEIVTQTGDYADGSFPPPLDIGRVAIASNLVKLAHGDIEPLFGRK